MSNEELNSAYNQASLGADSPQYIFTSANGLRAMAKTLDADGLLGYVEFANALPVGHIIMLSQNGLSYVQVDQPVDILSPNHAGDTITVQNLSDGPVTIK